ncbi:hypothetical protein CDAR_604141 [Caerostris darwini]|uniref:Uncharacterized protein n=1 Tax=Caerostris darwini TaxID=1538125 RepID=A0AAV4QRQ9_9ARAC|nr:hypothetical protein CDAR_604141 [Caerostris darwini]
MSARHTMEAGIPPVPLELLTLIAQTAYPLADFNDGSNFPSTNIYSSLAVNRFLFIFSLPPASAQSPTEIVNQSIRVMYPTLFK